MYENLLEKQAEEYFKKLPIVKNFPAITF